MELASALQTPHSMNEQERALLMALLPHEHPLRDALVLHAEAASVEWFEAGGSPIIEFNVDRSRVPPVESEHRVVSEGEVSDKDGVTIHLLLHVVDGYLEEIELVREDDNDVIALPESDRIGNLIFGQDERFL